MDSTDCKAEDVVINAAGGKQSKIVMGWTNLPFEALEQVAGMLKQGEEKRGKDNWKLIHHRDHVEHAYRHIARYATLGDKEDLVCATCRLLFALALR